MASYQKSQKKRDLEHEIKNTLAVIKVFAQILKKRLGKVADKKSLSYIAKIDAQVDKLTKIVQRDSGQTRITQREKA